MAERELNRSERAAIRKLVTELCANYDSQDKICLPLDSSCYMLNKWWTGAYCRYFEKAVLPVDAALKSAITGEDTSMRPPRIDWRDGAFSSSAKPVYYNRYDFKNVRMEPIWRHSNAVKAGTFTA